MASYYPMRLLLILCVLLYFSKAHANQPAPGDGSNTDLVSVEELVVRVKNSKKILSVKIELEQPSEMIQRNLYLVKGKLGDGLVNIFTYKTVGQAKRDKEKMRAAVGKLLVELLKDVAPISGPVPVRFARFEFRDLR